MSDEAFFVEFCWPIHGPAELNELIQTYIHMKKKRKKSKTKILLDVIQHAFQANLHGLDCLLAALLVDRLENDDPETVIHTLKLSPDHHVTARKKVLKEHLAPLFEGSTPTAHALYQCMSEKDGDISSVRSNTSDAKLNGTTRLFGQLRNNWEMWLELRDVLPRELRWTPTTPTGETSIEDLGLENRTVNVLHNLPLEISREVIECLADLNRDAIYDKLTSGNTRHWGEHCENDFYRRLATCFALNPELKTVLTKWVGLIKEPAFSTKQPDTVDDQLSEKLKAAGFSSPIGLLATNPAYGVAAMIETGSTAAEIRSVIVVALQHFDNAKVHSGTWREFLEIEQ